MRYRIHLEYVGTHYHGWQSQPDGQTVQDHLEKALAKFLQIKVKTIGSSRTDSGVHALDQVCIFDCEKQIESTNFLRAMRSLLPPDICAKEIQEVDADFHPITSAIAKVYRYSLWNNPDWLSPFLHGHVWHYYPKLDVSKMRAAASFLRGEHDFSSFAAADGCAKTTVRTIRDIEIVLASPHLLEVWVLGTGFLKQMVRNIVGTLVEVGVGKLEVKALPGILAACDRRQAGPTAPAAGLALVKVFYDEPISLEVVKKS